MKEEILVSRCCLGVPCRYHGKPTVFKKKAKLLSQKYSLIPVCPEVMGGLPTPRPGCFVNQNKVFSFKGHKDYSFQYKIGALKVLQIARERGIKKFYGLKHSPSCGKGYGITAKLLEKKGLKVFHL